MTDVTQILAQIESGDATAADDLLPLVYAELRRLAAARMARELPGQTLQPTALVHEAYVRLVHGQQFQQWGSRAHFFGAAAEAMRRILVERARRRKTLKRGGDRRRVELDRISIEAPDLDLVALDEALAKFEQEAPRTAQLVKLRFFAGCDLAEAAKLLGISVSTARRDWIYARAWLYGAIAGE